VGSKPKGRVYREKTTKNKVESDKENNYYSSEDDNLLEDENEDWHEVNRKKLNYDENS
jgi:hypothetical protein